MKWPRQLVRPAGVEDMSNLLKIMDSWLNGEPVWRYDRILQEWGADFEMYRKQWSTKGLWSTPRTTERTTGMHMLRDEWINRYGFAIPCAELLDVLDFTAPSVIDIGAGTGYMTRLMRNRGIKVIGSDIHENEYGFQPTYDRLQQAIQGKTMVRRHRDSLVFCSWPSLNRTWFRQALKAMQIGQRIVVIREDSCAEDTAWNYFDDCFERESTIDIPAFGYMNDYADVRIKKRQRGRDAAISSSSAD